MPRQSCPARFQPEGPKLLGDQGDAVWAARGRLVIVHPRGREGFEETFDHVRQRARLIRQPLALLIVIRDNTQRPDERTRANIQRSFVELRPLVACSAVVVLGQGFFAGFFISLVSRALMLVGDAGSPRALRTDFEGAASFVSTRLADPLVTESEVLDALRWANDNQP